jgi:hypothetical protein
MYRFRFFAAVAIFTLTAAHAIAQTSQGTIAGAVTDPSGAAIVGATVSAKNTLGSDNRTVMTGPNGEYRVEAITPSSYTVSVSKPGFNTSEIRNIAVPASVVTSVNTQLVVGDVTQTVAVLASGGAAIQTDSAELSYTITSQEVSQLPIVTGNPIDLVLTEPGIVTVAFRDAGSAGNGEGFSVNGLSPRANNFLIDGFDNNDYDVSSHRARKPGSDQRGQHPDQRLCSRVWPRRRLCHKRDLQKRHEPVAWSGLGPL